MTLSQGASKLLNRLTKGKVTDDPRDAFISQAVKDKSFADIGGLWGTVNEKVSVAHEHGASALTMIDVTPKEHDLWSLFEKRRADLKLPDVHCISGDVLTIANATPPVQFDVVHCSGVLYHMPDPMRLLGALKAITRERLILSSAVTGTKVHGEKGVLEIPQGAALFIPALEGRDRAILKSYWQRFVGDTAVGITRETESWRVADFGPWWWLPTVEALKAMCQAAGFECQEGAYFWNDNAYVLLLSVVE
jgi:hypothetical protein